MSERTKVLIIEDLSSDAELAQREIAKALGECEFRRVETRPEFLDALETFRPVFIVSDFQLPQFDGMTALKLALELCPDVPFIIVTGSMNEDTAVECMKAGAWDYVIKEHIKRLGPAVQGALERQRTRIEARQAEHDLEASETRYRRLFEATKDGILILDAETGKIVDVNPFLMELTGYSHQDFLDRHLWEIGPIKDIAASKDSFANLQAKHYVHYEDLPLQAKDGRKIDVEVVSSVYRVDGQSVIQCSIRDITERKRAVETLAASEARYRSYVDTTGQIGWVSNSDGEVVEDLPSWRRFTGQTYEEMKGSGWAKALHPNDLEQTVQAWSSAVATKSAYEVEYRMRRHDGVYRYLLARGSPAFRADGSVREWVGTCIDITERKRAEEAIKASEERFRRLFDMAPLPLCHVTKDGVIDFRNQRFVHLFGYKADEVPTLAEWWLRAYPDPKYRRWVTETWDAAVRRAAAEGRDIDPVQYKVTCNSGEERIVEISGIVLGENFLATFIDRTERERAERDLQESKALVDAVVEHVPLMIFLKEAQDLRFVVFNNAGEDLVGYDRKDLLGKNDLDLFPPEQAAFFMAKDREVLASDTLVDIPEEPILTAEKGERLLHTRKICIKGADGVTKYLLGISEDITDRKRAEAQREQLEEQLRMSQKMEAIGSLAGGVAHDFNNLLSVILSYTGFVLKGVREGDPQRDDLLEVKKAGERAAALTRQLLAFSRKQMLQPAVLNLNQIATGVEKMLRRIIGEDIDFVQVLAPDLGAVKADPGQIEQMLMNLVVNARNAMPEGGKLTIETSNVEIDEEYAARHVAVKPGSYVQLAVSDTGCGMDEQTRARIFEPFFTTKEKGKGTGLGLSTVYGIVKQSGGNIWVYSELGQGTTFKIYLPREFSATTVADIKPSTVPQRATGSETILVVEDEEALRKVALRTLGAAGYKVLTAADGDEALLVSAQHVGDIHMLLTDVVMPRMSGRVLAQQLSKTRPTVKVLYMSGYTDNAIVHHGVLDAGTHFLAKPFTSTDLARKVREVLDEGISSLADG